MPAYFVGKPYLAGRTLWSAGSRYSYRFDGHELILFVRGVTARQEADLRGGTVDLALVADKREVVLCACFGASLPWSHSDPFHWREVPRTRRGVPPSPATNPGLHAQLRVTLVDADTGLVRAQRTTFLPPLFTTALNEAIRAQTKAPGGGDHAGRSVARIHRLAPGGLWEPAFRYAERTPWEEQR